jgi:hypothetical protein
LVTHTTWKSTWGRTDNTRHSTWQQLMPHWQNWQGR